MIETIYLDMDGVLADFDAYFHQLIGVEPSTYESEYGTQKFWSEIYRHPRFFQDMPVMDGALDLIANCQALCDDVCILSAPSRINMPLCMMQKRKWIDETIGWEFPAIFESNKDKYAHDKAILIDDRESKVDAFVSSGGHGILYTQERHYRIIDELIKYEYE